MKLYWIPKTRSFRAVWMLEEAGLPYERVRMDMGNLATPEFRAINPMMKVPALEDGDARLAESAAICAYVADKAVDAGLAPALGDPARGRYLHWLFFSSNCMEAAFTEKMAKVDLPTTAAGWGSFDRVMDVLEGAIMPGPWALGERFSAVDVMFGTDLGFGMGLLKVIEPRPAFTAYLERCHARPAFQRALAIEAAGV